jgi:hypothetical protein
VTVNDLELGLSPPNAGGSGERSRSRWIGGCGHDAGDAVVSWPRSGRNLDLSAAGMFELDAATKQVRAVSGAGVGHCTRNVSFAHEDVVGTITVQLADFVALSGRVCNAIAKLLGINHRVCEPVVVNRRLVASDLRSSCSQARDGADKQVQARTTAVSCFKLNTAMSCQALRHRGRLDLCLTLRRL